MKHFWLFILLWLTVSGETQELRPLTKTAEKNPLEARSTIVWLENPSAVREFRVDPLHVTSQFERALTLYTRTATPAAAWKTLGIKADDRVGIKITTAGGPLRATQHCLISAIVSSLATAGVTPDRIIVWDKFEADMIQAGYVPALSHNGSPTYKAVIPGSGFDPSVFYVNEVLGKLIWGDHLFQGKKPTRSDMLKAVTPVIEVQSSDKTEIVRSKDEDQTSNKSFFARILTQECTKIINVPALSDHQSVGLQGCLSSLALGSTDNTRRFMGPGIAGDPAIGEILDRDLFRKKVVLHVVDAMIAQYAGGPEFSPQFTQSIGAIGLGTDPVALDSYALSLIRKWRADAKIDPIAPLDAHVDSCAKMGLGINDLKRIDVVNSHKK